MRTFRCGLPLLGIMVLCSACATHVPSAPVEAPSAPPVVVTPPPPAPPKAADLVVDGQPIDLDSERYQALFAELRTKHGFSEEELRAVFAGATIKRRVLELMDMQWEAKPYYQYYPRFITPGVISKGKKLIQEHRAVLDRIEAEIGVEREIVVAIWGIETQFGNHEGAFFLFQTLNTLFDAYPRRSKFYRQELIEFLLLCRENGVDPLKVTGSYGGAFGQTQFIPSSFRSYAVDFDGDGRRDVWKSVPDVLASIANYLKRSGWVLGAPVYWELGEELRDDRLTEAYKAGRKGMVPWKVVQEAQGIALAKPPGGKAVTIVGLEREDGGMRYVAGYPNFQAITKWNNSNRYAMAVSELAEKFRGTVAPPTSVPVAGSEGEGL
ncbi:MAG TPA: lytic murein transglycosylase [Desulfurivibrionaceae bacterium]|nr:lytic murein transglycosylase [Desulfurivibrionaceae bacterium]